MPPHRNQLHLSQSLVHRQLFFVLIFSKMRNRLSWKRLTCKMTLITCLETISLASYGRKIPTKRILTRKKATESISLWYLGMVNRKSSYISENCINRLRICRRIAKRSCQSWLLILNAKVVIT